MENYVLNRSLFREHLENTGLNVSYFCFFTSINPIVIIKMLIGEMDNIEMVDIRRFADELKVKPEKLFCPFRGD